MEKLAQAQEVLEMVPTVLRELVAERDALLEKNAEQAAELETYRRNGRIEKIAKSMEDKHIDLGTSFADKIAKVKEAADQGKSLDVIEEAVKMAAPVQNLGRLGDDQEVGNGATELEAFLLGGLES
jgi:hypothetical protein